MTTIYNINLLGDGGVGKTACIHKMRTDEFEKKYIATIGCNVYPDLVHTNYGDFELNLYDYAGQEKYSSIFGVPQSDATVLMFDLTSPISHKNLKSWYSKWCHDEPVFVVGNKCDIAEIKVTPKFHMKHNLPYMALSAKTVTSAEFFTPILRRLTGHDDLVIIE